MPFLHSNVVYGLPANDPAQVGKTNNDSDSIIEQAIGIPWSSNREASWVYFDCAVGVMLDSGIVVHNRLPQYKSSAFDTLASVALDDPKFDALAGPGVNVACRDQYTDIIQRMGHARYWFRLWGQALRVGYKIPIPGIKTIGGVPAIPYDKNPQWAYCGIAPGGNYSGVILWRAQWSLWYTTAVPPKNQTIPEADPSAHITGTSELPKEMQAPYSRADDNAKRTPTFDVPGIVVPK